MPNAYPLVISMAVRLACFPARFGLSRPTALDELANKELVSLFESEWSPITPTDDDTPRLYALDLLIKTSLSEAFSEGSKHGTRQSVVDNLTFFQRAGQRAITSIYGLQQLDFQSMRSSPFSFCDRVVDPLAAARIKAIQGKFSQADANRPSHLHLNIADTLNMKTTLLTILHTTEFFLRNGTYCGIRLSKGNLEEAPIEAVRRHRAKKPTEAEIKNAILAGMQASVREVVGANDSEEAEAAAKLLAHSLDTVFVFKDEEEEAAKAKENEEVGSEDLVSESELFGEDGADSSDSDSAPVDLGNLCLSAFESAQSCCAAAMCSGCLIQDQLGLRVFLASENATLQCADCDALVHVLGATFLASSTSACKRCSRPRCIDCSERSERKEKPSMNCSRCRNAKKAAAAAAPAAAAAMEAARAAIAREETERLAYEMRRGAVGSAKKRNGRR